MKMTDIFDWSSEELDSIYDDSFTDSEGIERLEDTCYDSEMELLKPHLVRLKKFCKE